MLSDLFNQWFFIYHYWFSEDELEDKKRFLDCYGKCLNLEQDQPDDDLEQFELEMLNEARNHINGVHIIANDKSNNNQTNDNNNDTNHDKEQSLKKISRKKAQDDYDQLFYNPDEDESNQEWINSKVFQETSRQGKF